MNNIIVLTSEQLDNVIDRAVVAGVNAYQSMVDKNTYLTVKETSEALKKDCRTIISMCKRGELDFKMVGSEYRVLKSSLLKQ